MATSPQHPAKHRAHFFKAFASRASVLQLPKVKLPNGFQVAALKVMRLALKRQQLNSSGDWADGRARPDVPASYKSETRPPSVGHVALVSNVLPPCKVAKTSDAGSFTKIMEMFRKAVQKRQKYTLWKEGLANCWPDMYRTCMRSRDQHWQ